MKKSDRLPVLRYSYNNAWGELNQNPNRDRILWREVSIKGMLSGFELVYGGNPFGVGMVCRVSETDRRENFSRLMMRFFSIEDVVANDPGIYGYRYEVEFYAITLLDSLFVDGGDQRLFEVVGLTERK